MDIHLVTTNVRLERWTGIIQDRINSGLTVKDYCIQNHVTRDAYFYWLRRIKLTAMESNPTHKVSGVHDCFRSKHNVRFYIGDVREHKLPHAVSGK